MECNKEEAIRAKGIAEKKMQNKDFSGALRIALKAQQLYPDLERISQMITICDVLCSAEKNVFGNVKDWYGILKIEPTADDASIRKQYRKFALLVHPDKNHFAGAEDAFRLIGAAHSVLVDRDRRWFHNLLCKAMSPARNYKNQCVFDSTGSSSDSEEEIVFEKNGANYGFHGKYPQRSSRSKQNVSYDIIEISSDDDDNDFGSPLKRAKCSGPSEQPKSAN